MNDTNPPLKHSSNDIHTQSNPNPTDEKIRLIKAETEAKARLAEIELKKAERLRQIDAQKATELSKLEAEKTKQLKKIELEQTLSTNNTNSQIAATKAKADIQLQQKKIIFYRELMYATVVIVILVLVFAYLIYRRKQTLKLKMHEEELKHQAYLAASQQHHEQVNKILNIITNEHTEKAVKKELTKLLAQNQNYNLPPADRQEITDNHITDIES